MKLTCVGDALVVAVALTELADEVAVRAAQDVAVDAVVAAVPSEATFVFSDWSAATNFWVSDCFVLSRVCGPDSTCMSESISWVVFRPLTRPSMPMLLVATRSVLCRRCDAR